ncbi:hypothetical protein VTL71DRAFT_13569 [Oculimacula yallundae]|uniref:Uncharacterized protein n=1 Tax=Oculimacula yallundae TaxID=86028 RepID=A0ABR4CKV0_9HELO
MASAILTFAVATPTPAGALLDPDTKIIDTPVPWSHSTAETTDEAPIRIDNVAGGSKDIHVPFSKVVPVPWAKRSKPIEEVEVVEADTAVCSPNWCAKNSHCRGTCGRCHHGTCRPWLKVAGDDEVSE